MGLFPGSHDDHAGQGKTYGPLPDHGKTNVKLVLHTTETKGMPSFGGGDTAPHYVYKPASRAFYMFSEWSDGWVGTLVGHSSGGHGNCQAFQLEILAYSDRNAASSVGGLWVGDFTDEHYADLAGFVAWARQTYGIGGDVYAAPASGWIYGTGSPLRLNEPAYDALAGLTAHGAVPHNRHWDTGVLDLARISGGGVVPPPTDPDPEPLPPDPDPEPNGDTVYPMYLTDGYATPSGSGRSAKREDVRILQGMVNDAGGSLHEDGLLGPATMQAVADVSGEPASDVVTGVHGNALRRAV